MEMLRNLNPQLSLGVMALQFACSDPVVNSTPLVSLPPPPTGGVAAVDLPYEPCSNSTRTGDFRIELAEEYTRFDGKVLDSVPPLQVTAPSTMAGDCQLLQAPVITCNPLCAFSTETCGPMGCVPLPQAVDLGKVYVYGLSREMGLDAHPITGSYSNPSEPVLPHPGFSSGADLRVVLGEGEESIELRGWGIEPLGIDVDPVEVSGGQTATVTWQSVEPAGPARIVAELNIDNHGSSNAAIRCDFPDTGRGQIPAELIDALMTAGSSGFPTLELRRRTVTSASRGAHCVQLQVNSRATPSLVVDGLTSCNNNEDCPSGTTCTPLDRICE